MQNSIADSYTYYRVCNTMTRCHPITWTWGVIDHHVTMSCGGGNSSQTEKKALRFDSEQTYLCS